MNAPATAAAPTAPNAVQPAPKKAWLTMNEDDFTAYLKTAKIGGKRAEQMRAERAGKPLPPAPAVIGGVPVVRAADVVSVNDPALAEHPVAQQNAASWPGGPKPPRTRKGQGTLSDLQKREDVPLQPVAPKPAPGLVTRYIDPTMIDVRADWNARFDFGDIDELAASIYAQKKLDGHGLINDIRVKEKADGRYELIDGERRYNAVMGLMDQGEEWAFGIPAKVEPADATDADLIIKMFTANMGKNFLPIEEAHFYKRLRDSGMTIAQIEAKTGRSDNSIVGALALLDADEDLVEAVTKGQVGNTLAKSIAVNARGDKTKQKALTAAAKAATASKDRVALKKVKKDIDDSRRAKAAKKMPNKVLKIRALDDHELAQLGTNVGLRLRDLLEKQGMAFDTDLEAWVAADRELQIAACFGALQALKAGAGVKADLTFGGDA